MTRPSPDAGDARPGDGDLAGLSGRRHLLSAAEHDRAHLDFGRYRAEGCGAGQRCFPVAPAPAGGGGIVRAEEAGIGSLAGRRGAGLVVLSLIGLRPAAGPAIALGVTRSAS